MVFFPHCFDSDISNVRTMMRTPAVPRLRRGLRLRARELMVIYLGAVALLPGELAIAEKFFEGFQHRIMQKEQTKTQYGPTIEGRVAKCSLTASDTGEITKHGATALTLSIQNLTAKIECHGPRNQAVPLGLGIVCDPSLKGINGTCQFGASTGGIEAMDITLQKLLGTQKFLSFTEDVPYEHTYRGEKWTLNLTADDLPLEDIPFFVGCQEDPTSDDSANKPSCVVPVHVEARPSVQADNVVTCAYGHNSNKQPVEVEITTDKNAVTVECGSLGFVTSRNVATECCATDDPLAEERTGKKYTDVLPIIEASWVEKGGVTTSVTLTIPVSAFPSKDLKIRLACAPRKPSGTTDPETTTGQFGAATSCNVIATVKTTRSASSALSSLWAVTASGAASVAGLLSTSF
ncbi:SAG-related sequence SRS19A [Toxoplasma gondii ARI]|uniref:SAG-related sequence SRS19A n=1 Tax=Toxoplasma gondii ARI TaxID=1074872 RepID=A0A139XJG7_TOXGO|nr:SAG-related sequence SRS19A [Toxoplasma gondii ARI]